MLTDIRTALDSVRNDESLPNVIRVAAHATRLVADKYDNLCDESEVYKIAIGEQNMLLDV